MPLGHALPDVGLTLYRIGVIEPERGLRVRDEAGQLLPTTWRSFDHFKS